jgi:ketohexokinase
MSRILCCGIVALDIINLVSHYPAEDEELRASGQERRSGGNAANTAQVLGQLGHEVGLIATVANDQNGDFLLQKLTASGIDTSACPRLPGSTPTSYITLNRQNGSRTIIHYRQLDELTAEQFPAIPPRQYDWLHFEGRNVPQLIRILKGLHQAGKPCPLSLEAEKPRKGIESLFALVDVIMFSRDFAVQAGFSDAQGFLTHQQQRTPGKLLTCTWGSAGVWHCNGDGPLIHTPAISGIEVIDTIGAGDTFNAGLIHACLQHDSPGQAVAHANRLAAAKIGQQGFDDLLQP